MAIESILYQSKKPDKIIIWLAKDEFESKRTLPIRLLRLQKRGLEIRFVQENLMPHKKYFYTIQKYPAARVITVDDDLLYPPDLIDKLLDRNLDYPNAIICPVARRISIGKNRVMKYKYWKKVTSNSLPNHILLTIGAAGVFFPVNCLSKKAFNADKIKSTALKADDLWIKVMALLNDTKVVSLAADFPYSYLPIFHEDNQNLMDANIEGGNNDFVFQVLLKEYNIQLDEILEKRRG